MCLNMYFMSPPFIIILYIVLLWYTIYVRDIHPSINHPHIFTYSLAVVADACRNWRASVKSIVHQQNHIPTTRKDNVPVFCSKGSSQPKVYLLLDDELGVANDFHNTDHLDFLEKEN